GLLNDLLREVLSPQDTEHDAEEFRPRGGIKPLKRGLIPLRYGGNQPDQLSWRQHSVSPKSCPPAFRAAAAAVQACRIISCAEPVHQVAGGQPVDIRKKPGPRGPGFVVRQENGSRRPPRCG